MSKLLDEYRLMLNMRLHVAELTARIAELEGEIDRMDERTPNTDVETGVEAKPCPFCGAVPKPDYDGFFEDYRQVVMCPTEHCTMSAVMMDFGDWQRRPVEDKLEAELAALRPWAKVGKQCVAEWWYALDTIGDGQITHLRCCGAQGWDNDAAPHQDCLIPALTKQLEDDNAS